MNILHQGKTQLGELDKKGQCAVERHIEEWNNKHISGLKIGHRINGDRWMVVPPVKTFCQETAPSNKRCEGYQASGAAMYDGEIKK